jgi:hypothetical protein
MVEATLVAAVAAAAVVAATATVAVVVNERWRARAVGECIWRGG